MQTILFITSLISLAAMAVAFGCAGAFLFSKKIRKNWKVHFTVGTCVALFAADSLIWLLVFRKSHGWIDGLWVAVYVFVSWYAFSEAKKLRALQRSATNT